MKWLAESVVSAVQVRSENRVINHSNIHIPAYTSRTLAFLETAWLYLVYKAYTYVGKVISLDVLPHYLRELAFKLMPIDDAKSRHQMLSSITLLLECCSQYATYNPLVQCYINYKDRSLPLCCSGWCCPCRRNEVFFRVISFSTFLITLSPRLHGAEWPCLRTWLLICKSPLIRGASRITFRNYKEWTW